MPGVSIKDAVVFVTGANRGIGLAVGLLFALATPPPPPAATTVVSVPDERLTRTGSLHRSAARIRPSATSPAPAR